MGLSHIATNSVFRVKTQIRHLCLEASHLGYNKFRQYMYSIWDANYTDNAYTVHQAPLLLFFFLFACGITRKKKRKKDRKERKKEKEVLCLTTKKLYDNQISQLMRKKVLRFSV